MLKRTGPNIYEALALFVIAVSLCQHSTERQSPGTEKAEKRNYLSLLPALPEDVPVTFIVGILKTQQAVIAQPVVGCIKTHYRRLYSQSLRFLRQVCNGPVLHQGGKNVIEDFGCSL